tara:strand:- start:703 stop:1068 length:366 start_codon:yes stop_codon:yes gene_type:complete
MATKQERLLSYDEATGRTEIYHYDAVEDRSIVETVQDIEPILIQNRAEYNSFDENARFGSPLTQSQETFHHVGRVPNVILEQMPPEMRQGIMSGKGLQGKAWKRWINDPDNRMFRTRPGRV